MRQVIKIPNVGESITEVSILKWNKQAGQPVNAGELILEIESDKATVELIAEATGILSILKQAGERIPVGEVVGFIEAALMSDEKEIAPGAKVSEVPEPSKLPRTPPPPPPAATLSGASAMNGEVIPTVKSTEQSQGPDVNLSPAVRKAVSEQGLHPSEINGSGKNGRITKGDVIEFAAQKTGNNLATEKVSPPHDPVLPNPLSTTVTDQNPGDRRVSMSLLRTRIAEKLVHAQHTAAILTTFNEADMSAVMDIRNKYKDAFKAKNGVALSFMSFFTRACVEALRIVPEVNAFIEGKDILYHDFYDIGIAVGTERGLVVPVLRDVGKMGFVQIEKEMAHLAEKARTSKLSISDLKGGTFTISNGGVYGSLLSTPILNPPQSGILGMHKILERPVAIDRKVEVKPMMYIALSYDHRLIDGKGAVTFLVKVKEFIENPEILNLDGVTNG